MYIIGRSAKTEICASCSNILESLEFNKTHFYETQIYINISLQQMMENWKRKNFLRESVTLVYWTA